MTVLSDRQSRLLETWLGTWETIDDFSWSLQDTVVLRVRNHGGDHVVKASQSDHHIAREINSHYEVLSRITAPISRLEHADLDAGILVTKFLPGELVLHSLSEWSADVYRQAGEILAQIQVPFGTSSDYVHEALSSEKKFLDKASGLIPPIELKAIVNFLDNFQRRSVQLHFTHGDYQPRNWLTNEGTISVIDFGRGAQRSWVSDLVRLQNQQFIGHPELEKAFMEGVGRSLTDVDLEMLQLETLRQSTGTVVWAHNIGDNEFEEHGRQMIARFLDSNS